jgi:hypothetical protein
MQTTIILCRFLFQLLTVIRPWSVFVCRHPNLYVVILERSEGFLY